MPGKVAITALLLVAAAWGQSAAPAAPAPALRNPFAKPTAALAAPPAAKPAAAVTTKSAPPAPPAAPAAPEFIRPRNARDPFISPVQAETEEQPACASGKRCLVIDKIRLQGVVRADSGFIAVVVNPANRTFFLRENDPLWNGYVLRITNNAVTFRETGKDRLGRQTSREVTKTLGGPAA